MGYAINNNDFFFHYSYIYEFFNTASVDYTSYDMLVKQCEAAITYLTTCGQKVFKSGGNIQKFLDAAKVSTCNSYLSSTSKHNFFIIGCV